MSNINGVGQIPLILPNIHVVKLGGVTGLYLDLFSSFSIGVDPVALECAKDRIEAALFDPEPGFPGLESSPSGHEGL